MAQAQHCNEHVNSCANIAQDYIKNVKRGRGYSCFLAKGHLVPDADFAYPSLKSSTFMYLNAVPQYQCANAGNWLNRVEKNARAYALQSGTTLSIITGGHEQLHLPNSANVDAPLFLADNKSIVPRYTWKIVVDPNGAKAGIVFVMMNSPFAAATDMLSKCTVAVCTSANIVANGFEKIESGYTACCKVDDFMSHVAVPENMRTSNLLVMNPK